MDEVAIVLAAAALVVALVALRATRRAREAMLEPRGASEPRSAPSEPAYDPYRAPGETASVVLLEHGPRKILAIKAIRKATGLGLREAKDLVEAPTPVTVAEGLPLAQAHALLADLESAGATAELE